MLFFTSVSDASPREDEQKFEVVSWIYRYIKQRHGNSHALGSTDNTVTGCTRPVTPKILVPGWRVLALLLASVAVEFSEVTKLEKNSPKGRWG